MAVLAIWLWKDEGDKESATTEIAAAGSPLAGGGATPEIRSLAVLPLANLSGDPEQEFFSDGMTEALITELARLGTLRVISRTSAMRYKDSEEPLSEIGRQLGVEAVVAGSVLQVGNEVRINAQLLHTPTDSHLWAAEYQRELESVLRLQKEIARDVAGRVRAAVGGDGGGSLVEAELVDPEVYQAVLRGRYHVWRATPQDFARAAHWFEVALARDPAYAKAHSGLAQLHFLSGIYGDLPPSRVISAVQREATTALELDEKDAEAHMVLGALEIMYLCRPDAAQERLTRATDLDPSLSEAHVLRGWAYLVTGRFELGLQHQRKALSVDPLSPFLNGDYGWVLVLTGRPEEGIQHLEETLELAPGFWRTHWFLSDALAAAGRYAAAVAAAERAVELSGSGLIAQAGLAVALARAGERARAVRILERLRNEERYVRPVWLAGIEASLGDLDSAFVSIDRAVAEKAAVTCPNLRLNPVFEPLRGDPRYTELMTRLGLE